MYFSNPKKFHRLLSDAGPRLLVIRDDVKLASLVRARDCLSQGCLFDSCKKHKNRELKSTFEDIKLPANLLDYFLRLGKVITATSINQIELTKGPKFEDRIVEK